MPELMLPREGLTEEVLKRAVHEYDLQILNSPDRALEAAKQIADVEYLRSGQEFGTNSCKSQNEEVPPSAREAMYENYRRANSDGRIETQWTMSQKLAAFTLFVEKGTDNNFTLHRVRMGGDWRKADDGQQLADAVTKVLRQRSYDVQTIGRNDEAADKIITVDPQQTNEPGFIALRRKRQMLVATRVFTDNKHCQVEEKIKVLKSSLFALDIGALALDALAAAQEVRLSVIAHRVDAADITGLEWHFEALANGNDQNQESKWSYEGSEEDLRRRQFGLAQLRWSFEKMQRYGITYDQLAARMRSPQGYARLVNEDSINSIEAEIKGQGENGVLIPAATTLWAHRKLKVLEG